MRNYKNYEVWSLAHSFILKIYNISKSFPKEETYGLVSQLRRASSSINLNIAEGCGRETDMEFKRFLSIALGSAFETEYILLLSKDLNYISQQEFLELSQNIESIKMKLSKLILKINNDHQKAISGQQ